MNIAPLCPVQTVATSRCQHCMFGYTSQDFPLSNDIDEKSLLARCTISGIISP